MNEQGSRIRRLQLLALAAAAVAVVLASTGCQKAAPAQSNGAESPAKRELVFAAYSIPDKAYEKIIPAFQEYWKQKTGEEVAITPSYGGSGAQARAVIDGLEADIVHLAMEPDVDKIEEAGLIDPGWQERTTGKGIPTTSLIVIGVRPGNPKSVKEWADVSRKGIGVITPDPQSSGGAQWNLLASWGSVSQNGGSEDQAYDQVEALYENAVVLDKSARDASNTFLRKGIGDVALLWESDANIGKAEGEKFDIVIPSSTILAQTAATVVDANAKKHDTEDVARAFIDFLFTPEAQQAFAETGLRPVDDGVLQDNSSKFPTPSGNVFTIADFGGWGEAKPKFFGDTGAYSQIESDVAKNR